MATSVTDVGGPAVLRAPRPEPDVRRLLRQLSVRPSMDERYSLRRARRDWQLLVKALGSREQVSRVAVHSFPGASEPIRLRVYTPEGGQAPGPVLVWLHGGGFVLGDLYTAGGTCRALANRTGAVVVAVDYRLAPEYDLQDGREDCVAAVRWVLANAGRIGADPSRIAIAGDSAGAMFAALVAQECARQGGPELCAQLLVYPATDLGGTYASTTENAEGYFLGREQIAWMHGHITRVADLSDPRLSPLQAASLSGLPPTVAITCGFDPIRDEGLAYLARLRQAGVPVAAVHYPGQIHGFMSFDRVLSGAQDALDRIGAALTGVFGGEGVADGLEIADGSGRHRGLLGLPGELSQRVNEAIVGSIIVREQALDLSDTLLSRVWRVWNLPSGRDIDALRDELAEAKRQVRAMQHEARSGAGR